ncbi:MAG: DUF3276 family protein [Ginsengibacter sp.]
MAYENNDKKLESVYSQRVRAGKRRTYFFDVRETRGNDYYLTITESRKKFNEDGYERHKIFLYKEDFNKFLKGMTEAIDFVKTDLMPDFDFDAFNHENQEGYEGAPYEGPKADNSEDVQNAPIEAEDLTAPSGIAEAATPELDGLPENPAEAEKSIPGENNSEEPNNMRDVEVDKW